MVMAAVMRGSVSAIGAGSIPVPAPVSTRGRRIILRSIVARSVAAAHHGPAMMNRLRTVMMVTPNGECVVRKCGQGRHGDCDAK